MQVLSFYIFVLTCVVTIVECTKLIFRANCQSNLDNQFHTTGSIGTYNNVDKLSACLQICADNIHCLVFFYNINIQTCILHSSRNITPSKSGSGWKFYILDEVTSRCPSSTGLVYHRYLDLCYKILPTKPARYWDVKQDCYDEGLDLIRVNSALKNAFLLEVFKDVFFNPTQYICIQGTNKIGPSYADWTYDDGTPLQYANWDIYTYIKPQPENRANENMILISRIQGYWHDFVPNWGRDCLILCEKS